MSLTSDSLNHVGVSHNRDTLHRLSIHNINNNNNKPPSPRERLESKTDCLY